MKTAWYIMCAVVIVLIGLNLYQCDRKKEVVIQTDDTASRQRIEKLMADSAAQRLAIDSILIRRAVDGAKNEVSLNRLKMRNSTLSNSLAEARTQIQVLIDSIPAVAHYVAVADSTIAMRDSTINHIEMIRFAEKASLNAEIALLGARHVTMVELSKEHEARIAELLDKGRKAERRKRFFRTTTVILIGAVGALILAK